MPRFYFDAEDGGLFCDPEGTILPDFEAAKREAIKILCQLLPMKGGDLDHSDFSLTVSDEARLALMTITVGAVFSPAVRAAPRIEPPARPRS